MFVQRLDRGDLSNDPIAICCRPSIWNGRGGGGGCVVDANEDRGMVETTADLDNNMFDETDRGV